MTNNLDHPSRVDKERIVYEYFRLIKKKDVNALLEIDEYISTLVSVSKLGAKVEDLAIKMANTPNNHLLVISL
jgi:hypothetical protein